MKKFHFPRNRIISALLVLACLLGLLPTAAFAASPSTIKMTDCDQSGNSYISASIGQCYVHQLKFDVNNKNTIGFCAEHGKGMGWSLEGQTWGHPQPVTDPTVKTMMAHFYAHSTGVFTDQAKALGEDQIWASDYVWTMDVWVQAVIWRYKGGLMSDPVTACAEELMSVYNGLKGGHYSSIDDLLDGTLFRDRAQYVLDLGAQGVWGDCDVYKYKYTGSSTSYQQVGNVQAIMIGELTVTREKYELTVKKVDATNPNKGLPGAKLKQGGRLLRTELYGEGLSDQTVRGVHTTLHAALDKAVSEKLLFRNPADGCHLPSAKAREMQVLSPEEIQRLLIQAKEDSCFEFLLLELSMGLRRGEICALQWDDLNFRTGELRVQRQVHRIKGKLVSSPPKTKAGNRSVILPAPVLMVLKEYRKSVNSCWMFPSPVNEDSPRGPAAVRKRLQIILARAECKKIRFMASDTHFLPLPWNMGWMLRPCPPSLATSPAVPH